MSSEISIGVARGRQGRAFARPSLIFALPLISLAWPDPIPRRGVIAFSISAPLGKGSGTVHSVHSCKDQWMSLSVDWLHDRNKAHAVLYVLKRMKL